MKKLFRNALALGAALAMTMGPAASAESLGIYQTTDRKMDFDLVFCGKDESRLCVKLLDARGSARVPRVVRMIGKNIVDGARPAGKNKWKGTVHYGGHSMNGTLTLSSTKFVMAGCAYIVICDDITLIPAE